jgi:hypothetical protein
MSDFSDEEVGAAVGLTVPKLGLAMDPVQKLKSSLAVSVGAKPDYEVELRKVAQATGVPVDTVRANPDEMKRKAALGNFDADTFAKQSPGTAAFLSDPNFARLSHDDTENMSLTETVLNGLGSNYALGAYKGYQGALGMAGDVAGHFTGDRSLSESALLKTRAAEEAGAELTPQFDSTLGTWAYGGAESLTGSAPALLAAVVDPVAALGMFGAQSGTEGYGKYRARGATPEQAAVGGGAEAAVTVGSTFLPLKFLTDKIGKAGAGEFLTGLLARDIPAMTAQTVANSAIDTAIANPEKSWTDWVKELPGDVGQAVVSALEFGGFFGAVHAGARTYARQQVKAEAAKGVAEGATKLNDLAGTSVVRPRDLETYNQFVKKANENGPIKDFYIDPNALAQNKIDVNELAKLSPTAADQLPEAIANGGDLKIPVEEFQTHVAGTDIGKALVDHLRPAPEAMSKAEADVFFQTKGEELKAEVEKTLEEHKTNQAFLDSAKTVHNYIFGQLESAKRFTSDVNQQYASLLSNFYTVQASRLGITPEEMFVKHPVQIQAEPVAGPRLDQKTSDQTVYWHGSVNVDDLRGGSTGLHLGTYEAARQALNARIGVPAEGEWDGTRVYGETLLAGKKRMRELEKQGRYVMTGFNVDAPELDYYPPEGKLKYADGTLTPIGVTPDIRPFKLNTEMTNSRGNPHPDFKANGYMKASLKKGSAKRGFYYENVGEDSGSISVVVPNGDHVVPHDPNIFHQEQRGAFDPATSTISLLKAADLSTFLHESGHFFLETLNKIALGADAPAELKADMDTTLQWLGVKDLAEWNAKSLEEQRPFHEQFARGFEAYLFEGKAPSVEIAKVFQRFRDWLLMVYKSLGNLKVELSPDMRQVFDRLLATQQQIADAETLRSYVPIFNTPEEAGMTPEQFKEYNDLGAQATQDGIVDLEARSLRDMQYASNAKSKMIRLMQRDAAARRKEVRAEVTEQVMSEPVNQARTFLKENKGANMDMVAESFGFSSGVELAEAIKNAEDPKEKIAGLTDMRMLERYGDLNSPEAIARAADKAIHNEVRTRFIATEMSALEVAVGDKRTLVAAAKHYAEETISKLAVKNVKPERYGAAEARAAKAADKARRADDLPEAARQKRNQVIQNYAARAAYKAVDEIEKTIRYAKKFDRKETRERVGTEIALIDKLLDDYDLRKTAVETKTTNKQSLRDWYEAQREAGYEPSVDGRLLEPDQKIHYTDMSVEALRGLRDTIRSIERIAKGRKEIMVNGQRLELREAVDDLLVPLQERGDKFTKEELINPPRKGVDSFFKVALFKMGSKLRLAATDLKPQDYKRNAYDLHEFAGPFGKYLFDPIFDRNYWKVDQLKTISDIFQAKVAELGDEWQKSLTDFVTNKTLADPDLSEPARETPGGLTNPTVTDPGHIVYMKITRGDLIGMARHFGNESNFAKLWKGYDWKPGDVWDFVMQNMTDKDWKAVQAEWDVYEKYWPETQAMIERLGGVVPDKIPLRPFKTPFGELAGGYAPIDYHPIRSKLSAKWGSPLADPGDSLSKGQNFKASTTFNGSLNNRQEGYTDRINLDYHYVARRLHETIHDLAYREVLINSRKILGNEKFREQFMKTFGKEEYQGLVAFLDNIANMASRDNHMNGFERAFAYTRQGVTMTAVAYRISTVLKHGGSAAIKTLGYQTGGGGKYLKARIVRMSTGNLAEEIAGAREKFPEIRARLLRMDRDFSAGSTSLYEPEDWRAKNDRYGHAFVAWSDALTAIPTAWAAYDWARTEGIPKELGGTGEPMSESDAVHYANKVVREAHGSAQDAARSNFLHDRGLKSLLGIIYGFQNNTLGQLGDTVDKLALGSKSRFSSKPELLAKAMVVLVMPAVWAYWLSKGKDDKEGWASWLGKAITAEAAGTVPGVRDAWSMVEATLENRDVGSAGQIPPMRMLGDIVKTGADAYKEFNGHDAKPIQDAANALGEWLHIAGLGQAGKTLQYVHDAHTGKEKPHDGVEYLQGATIGVHHHH